MRTSATPNAPREALFLLGKFALTEAIRAWENGGPDSLLQEQITARMVVFLRNNRHEPGAGLLWRSVEYARETPGIDADAFVHRLTAGLSCPRRTRITLSELGRRAVRTSWTGGTPAGKGRRKPRRRPRGG